MDTKTKRLKSSFIFGFIALLLCGVGDWLIGYEPKSGEPLMFGISNTSISQVPTWFYVLSLLFGILSGFGCYFFAPAILEVLKEKGVSESSKMFKTMEFGLASAPMMFVSFHVACCIVLLFIQASLRAGLDINSANSVFMVPVCAALVPFLIWCYLCDIPVTVAYMYFVLKGKLGISKAAFILCPFGLSIVGKIIGAVLVAVNSDFSFLTACAESWGYAFMCLAFYFAVNRKNSLRED